MSNIQKNSDLHIIARSTEEILQKIDITHTQDLGKKEKAKEVIKLFLTEFLPTPRASSKESAIREKIKTWAEKHGFIYEQDAYGNASFIVPATPGYEHIPPIALQFHMDMVAVKEADSTTDPAIDGVNPVLLQDTDNKLWLRSADKTSLGADDGTGASVILQVAKDMHGQQKPHGTLVVLATVEEETGLTGANHIVFPSDGKVRQFLENAKYFMNADGEKEGKITIGCAGGEFITITLPIEKEPTPDNVAFLTLKVAGLQGGHSGINAERISANCILMQWLKHVKDENNWRLTEVKGGEFDNAIPTYCQAIIAIQKNELSQIQDALKKHPQIVDEPTITYQVTSTEQKPERIMTKQSSQKLGHILSELGKLHGVNGYFESFEEKIPIRSMNFAIVDTTKQEKQIKLMSRLGKSEAHGKYFLQIQKITEPLGGIVKEDLWFAPWIPDPKSTLPNIAKDVYQKVFQKSLVLEITRGGLELGPLHETFPNSEKIALGTTITNAHSSKEQVEVQSIADCYFFLSGLIETLEEKLQIIGTKL